MTKPRPDMGILRKRRRKRRRLRRIPSHLTPLGNREANLPSCAASKWSDKRCCFLPEIGPEKFNVNDH